MPIYRGANPIESIYRGATKIGRVYRGSTLVYTSAPPVPLNFFEMIQAANADADIDFCVDAAALESYDPATDAQRWLDLTGNGNHFYRGGTSGSESSDPAFNGTPGGLSPDEYFSSSGNDFFRATAAHAYGQPWHKNNAICSLIAVAYRPNGSFVLYTTSTSVFGLRLWIPVTGGSPTGNLLTADVFNTTALSLRKQNTESVPQNEFVMLAGAIDESVGADGLTLQVNSVREKFTSTYSAPTVLDHSAIAQIGADSASVKFPSGARISCLAGWTRRLSDAELDAVYAQLKLRYTSLP